MTYIKQENRKIEEYEIQYFESKSYKTVYLQFIPLRVNIINANRISINLILFDGLSRMSFDHQFKQTQKYLLTLTKDYYIYDMLRYHTIGLNSRPNYVPLFYGIKYNRKHMKVYDVIL